jgi:hypothetical protein
MHKLYQVQTFEEELTHLEGSPKVSFYRWSYEDIHQFDWAFPNGDENPLYVCFSLKNGHAFLIAGKYELHGHLYFKKIKKKYFSHFLTYKPLMVFRFPGISDEKIAKIEAEIEARVGTRELTCMELIRQVLADAGDIHINGHTKKTRFLHEFFDRIFTGGFVTSVGRKVKFEAHIMQDKSLAAVYEHVGALERRFKILGYTGLFFYRIVSFFKYIKVFIKSIFKAS